MKRTERAAEIDELLGGYPAAVRETANAARELRTPADTERAGLKTLLQAALRAWRARSAAAMQ